PAPSAGAVAHVIRLISITVAGAAPVLDESAPDFPFKPFIVRGHSLWPRALERTPHAARSLLHGGGAVKSRAPAVPVASSPDCGTDGKRRRGNALQHGGGVGRLRRRAAAAGVSGSRGSAAGVCLAGNRAARGDRLGRGAARLRRCSALGACARRT